MSCESKVKNKAIFLRGVKPELYSWVKKEAKEHGYTLSGLINIIFSEAKENARHRKKCKSSN